MIVPSHGLLRRSHNLCLGSLIEAVRNQTRIVDLKQVNRVLIQPPRAQKTFHYQNLARAGCAVP
jgi:hypothetical protein